ncbi:MAG: HD domain-containing protein [Thermacetogeniaceae bacterium]
MIRFDRVLAGYNIPADVSRGSESQREFFYRILLGVFSPRIIPFLDRLLEVGELFGLAGVVSVGENQLHHVLRMLELAAQLPDDLLAELQIESQDLVNSVIFHDLGKGSEIDDSLFDPLGVSKIEAPALLRQYYGLIWAEWFTPLHDHVLRSYEIAARYKQPAPVLEAVALHHHVKIGPKALELVGHVLSLTGVVQLDVYNHHPEQYTARGSHLAQLVALLDQLCAIEKKFRLRLNTDLQSDQVEADVVRDLVIGITGMDDPRLRAIDITLTGNESVILLDLQAFGRFVKLHTEFEVQSVKISILQIIRSLVRVNRDRQEHDLVALIGGDEYAIVTRVRDQEQLLEMIRRIALAVKARTEFDLRFGIGAGGTIAENFHQARVQAEINKKCHFLTE